MTILPLLLVLLVLLILLGTKLVMAMRKLMVDLIMMMMKNLLVPSSWIILPLCVEICTMPIPNLSLRSSLNFLHHLMEKMMTMRTTRMMIVMLKDKKIL